MKTKFKTLIIIISVFALLSCTGNKANKKMNKINKDLLKTYVLTNAQGVYVKILNFGAKVMSIKVPDKEGNFGDIVLGYDTPEEYINGNPYFGAIIGRCANRIANGKFSLEGKEYSLCKNNGKNSLHGGPGGFNNVIWDVVEYKNDKENHFVKLKYFSKDNEEGYPGNLSVYVKYTLNNDNELIIDYEASCDKKTIINMTHHSFFNLKDGGKSTILEHVLKINADKYTPINNDFIPTGEIVSVKHTPFDFTEPVAIGERINDDFEQLHFGKGYDHNWVLNQGNDFLTFAAEVYEPVTGRKMDVYTTEPGIQFYSGNFLDGTDIGKNHVKYQYRSAFCLETQHFPDSPNHPNFPSVILNPGEKYHQKTIYKFSVVKK